MGKAIALKRIKLDDSASLNRVLKMINDDAELQSVFSGQKNTMTRLLNASYIAFIENRHQNVGFVMLVNNEKTNTQEVDMGILEGFRDLGYGTKALELLKEVVETNRIMIQVQIKNTNIPAIRTAEKNGCKLIRQNDECRYYEFDFEECHKII